MSCQEFESRVLFDEAVVEFVSKHFVCVLADAPWSKIGKRNAKTWEESETWKSGARSAELVWVVTADKRDRRGLNYREFKDPQKLLKQLQVYAREDRRIESAAGQCERLLVVNRSRARSIPLRRLHRDSQEKLTLKNRQRLLDSRNELESFLKKIPDDRLCPGDAAKLAKRLFADDKSERATLATRLNVLLGISADLKLTDDAVVVAVRGAVRNKHRDFADVTGLRYAGIALYARIEQRIAKGGPGSEAAGEKLRRLDAKPAKGAGAPVK